MRTITTATFGLILLTLIQSTANSEVDEASNFVGAFESMRTAIFEVLGEEGLSTVDAKRIADTAVTDLVECTKKVESPTGIAENDFEIVRIKGRTFVMPRNACVFDVLENAGVADW